MTRGQTREEGSDGDSGVELDVAAFAPHESAGGARGGPAARVHAAFAGARRGHVVVTDAGNRVVGVVTRKDVTRWRRRVGENADETMMTNASASVGIGIEREGAAPYVREAAPYVRGGAVSFGLAFAGRRRRALKRTYPIRRSPYTVALPLPT